MDWGSFTNHSSTSPTQPHASRIRFAPLPGRQGGGEPPSHVLGGADAGTLEEVEEVHEKGWGGVHQGSQEIYGGGKHGGCPQAEDHEHQQSVVIGGEQIGGQRPHPQEHDPVHEFFPADPVNQPAAVPGGIHRVGKVKAVVKGAVCLQREVSPVGDAIRLIDAFVVAGGDYRVGNILVEFCGLPGRGSGFRLRGGGLSAAGAFGKHQHAQQQCAAFLHIIHSMFRSSPARPQAAPFLFGFIIARTCLRLQGYLILTAPGSYGQAPWLPRSEAAPFA